MLKNYQKLKSFSKYVYKTNLRSLPVVKTPSLKTFVMNEKISTANENRGYQNTNNKHEQSKKLFNFFMVCIGFTSIYAIFSYLAQTSFFKADERKLPALHSGIASDPHTTEAGNMAFNYKNPNLKAFYDKFNNEFITSYDNHCETTSLFFYFKESKLMIIFIAAAAVIATLDAKKLQNAKEKFDELKSQDKGIDQITTAISNILGIGVQHFIGTFEDYQKTFKIASVGLASIYTYYKINDIRDARHKANNFLEIFSDFSGNSGKVAKYHIAKNLAEYLTFRFEETILKLTDMHEVERFAIHFSKCLNYNLMNSKATIENSGSFSLKNILITACISKPPNINLCINNQNDIKLWSKPSWGGCYCSFFRETKTMKFKDNRSISYIDLKFSSPIKYLHEDNCNNQIETSFNNSSESYWNRKIDPTLPKQHLISEEELIAMGFEPPKLRETISFEV